MALDTVLDTVLSTCRAHNSVARSAQPLVLCQRAHSWSTWWCLDHAASRLTEYTAPPGVCGVARSTRRRTDCVTVCTLSEYAATVRDLRSTRPQEYAAIGVRGHRHARLPDYVTLPRVRRIARSTRLPEYTVAGVHGRWRQRGGR